MSLLLSCFLKLKGAFVVTLVCLALVVRLTILDLLTPRKGPLVESFIFRIEEC